MEHLSYIVLRTQQKEDGIVANCENAIKNTTHRVGPVKV